MIEELPDDIENDVLDDIEPVSYTHLPVSVWTMLLLRRSMLISPIVAGIMRLHLIYRKPGRPFFLSLKHYGKRRNI